MKKSPRLTCIEICSGAGGQALGLEGAGFEALVHVENEGGLNGVSPRRFISHIN